MSLFTIKVEMSKTWIIRLIMLGFAIGFFFSNFVMTVPCMEGWTLAMEGWNETLVSLRLCFETCEIQRGTVLLYD